MWKNIADRYKNEPTIAGYDLLNEPDTDNKTLLNFLNQIAAAIRSVDQNHLLIWEGRDFAKDFKNFPEIPDANSIYSFHYYAWYSEGTKQRDISNIINNIPGKLPVLCGEWGEDSPANLTQIRDILNQNARVCGQIFWTWKKVQSNEKLPPAGIKDGAAWKKITNWFTWKLFKPSPAESDAAVAEFLNNIKLENRTLNSNVIDGSIR